MNKARQWTLPGGGQNEIQALPAETANHARAAQRVAGDRFDQCDVFGMDHITIPTAFDQQPAPFSIQQTNPGILSYKFGLLVGARFLKTDRSSGQTVKSPQ